MDLTIFEAKALANALTEHGHSVSERTVQRWKAGVTRPKPQDIRAIRELLQTQEKEPPEPAWVGRLEARLIELRANQDVVARAATQSAVEALLTPEMAEWRDQIAAALAALPMPASEATDDPADTRAQDTLAPLGQ